ncbi:ribonuclease J [Pinisolibacter aquiterrae]|uniref:ribonuclease J n=1 Tax=Pinisolibacter aquiterrae TaxID=2815579 RepID=UPI001C3D2D64|nr:ribonuclease J [Pinisolibacter aquiterrae]MBV5264447.1 ribonuclease J [Pinisolibacter aquiterrae]MCC8234404.1 ribonuclease J [Pinisolibacter aquiterrae]
MRKRPSKGDELVFLPLGGVGEIGMNLALYGFGPEDDRRWLMVDCGITFASEFDEPGVDLIFPDIRFIEEERKSLAGIVITHAHEDHFGALLELWPRLEAPLYMTPFAAGLLEAKAAAEPGARQIPVTRFTAGDRLTIGDFEVEAISVAHSIPEAVSLAIRTSLGCVIHTGDWKVDPTPVTGWATDFDRFRALGDEGVRALVNDSTNVLRDGSSPSERDVAESLAEIIAKAPARVGVTTFASNIGRIRAIAEAAQKADRNVVVMGRAMRRAIDVARECGLLDGLPEFLDDQAYGWLPRDKVVALLTGSQGESRAALARIAAGDHRHVAMSPGDMMIFSSRTIPGNEKSVNAIMNALAAKGVKIVTDRDGLVHVSGHPRRGEMRMLYEAVRPQVSVPVHGEALHLAVHADFARSLGVPEIGHALNGRMLRLAPGPVAEVDEVFTGRLFRDGSILTTPDKSGASARRKASFAGVITVALVIDAKGTALADPAIVLIGIPEEDARGKLFRDTVEVAASATLDGLPRPKRKDTAVVADAVKRAVRGAVNERWGKKPIVEVTVTVV